MITTPEAAGAPPLEELLRFRSLVCARAGPLLVQLWQHQPLAAEQRALNQACTQMAARYPQGFASIALIRLRELIGSPDAEVRRLALEGYRELRPHVRVSAIVIDERGLSAATARVFISAVLMLARPETPTRVFSSFDEAFAWMRDHGMPAPLLPHAAQLRESVEQWWEREAPPARAQRVSRSNF